MGESRKIQNRRERVESDHLEMASRKRRERKEQIRRGMRIWIKKVIFGGVILCLVMCMWIVTRNPKARRVK
jgi:hypothetical protein